MGVKKMSFVKRVLFIAFVFAFVMSLGFTSAFSNVAEAADPNVQLAYAKIQTNCNGSVCYRVTGGIEVKNLAYEKQVSVVYTTGNGQWNEVAATYAASIDNGFETWNFSQDAVAGATFEFTIKYVFNGQTYWDNNNGINYKIGGSANPDRILSKSTVKLDEAFYWSSRGGIYFTGNIVSKNLSNADTVNVIYTLNNWATTEVASANYNDSVIYSNDSLEKWGFSLAAFSGSPIQFAISYTANGVTYWDNNNGNNYSISVGQSIQ
jgi:hypothetical protein